jgi:hypothetical protein
MAKPLTSRKQAALLAATGESLDACTAGMKRLKHYTISGFVRWFSITNGDNYTGTIEVYERIKHTSRKKAEAAILDRLKERHGWADCHWQSATKVEVNNA